MRRGAGETVARAMLAAVLALVAACAAAGCSDERRAGPGDEADDPAAMQGEAIERVSELGPVRAVVRVWPTKPRLGDPITLVLEVAAEPGVVVEMPDFADALGRFRILHYQSREDTRDGKWVATQTYKLDPPMSGKQRIPPLRIEFLDERPGQGQGSGQAAGAANPGAANPDDPGDAGDAPGGMKELLTEEIALDVDSVLLDPGAALSEPLTRLRAPSSTSPLWQNVWLWLGVAAVLAAGLGSGLYYGLRRTRAKRRESAYTVAMARLGKLESRGLPAPEQADEWYVELSSIIRHYLEDRYNLRAPELTTEEFLQVARGSGVLTVEHRKLLEDFLVRCDRVKFAGYAPEDEESRETLDAARGFLFDTRPEADPAGGAEMPGPAGDPSRGAA